MEVLRYEDPAAFRHDGEPVLAAEPARNQLFLGLLQTLMDDPHVYPSFHLWLATDGDLLPGVVANRPWADRSAAVVGRRTGRGVARVLREGVWELTEVADVPVPPGAPRAATPLDRDLIMAWQGPSPRSLCRPTSRGTKPRPSASSTCAWRGPVAASGCGSGTDRYRCRGSGSSRGRRSFYTDLANPTSNAIYERIGYVKLCEAADLRFDVARSADA